jgi:hypothetical protein
LDQPAELFGGEVVGNRQVIKSIPKDEIVRLLVDRLTAALRADLHDLPRAGLRGVDAVDRVARRSNTKDLA